MRIAQIAPVAESVPPKLYGGTERVVSWLTEELVALGHDVTLFASADSKTAATLETVWPQATRLCRPHPDPLAVHSALLEKLAQRIGAFDVIHSHIDWIHIPLLSGAGVPFVTTVHGRLDLPHVEEVISRLPGASYISISNDQRLPQPNLSWMGTVYHGMPPNLLRPNFELGRHLAFLGRISPEKGPELAIRLAKAAGIPLRIAAKVPRDANRYFKERVQPLVDGDMIRFVGEIGEKGERATAQPGKSSVVYDRLAGAVRSSDDRSFGVWNSSHRAPARIGARNH